MKTGLNHTLEADPLKILLAKYVPDPNLRPQRDSSGEYSQTDLPTLITTNSWRATAKLARDQILVCDPSDALRILEVNLPENRSIFLTHRL